MYRTSALYKRVVGRDARTWRCGVSFPALETELDYGVIGKISFDDVITSGNRITLGSCCVNKITISLIDPPTMQYSGAVVEPYIELLVDTDQWERIPLGRFYITDTSTDNDYLSLKITGYDAFSKMDIQYTPTARIRNVLDFYNDLSSKLALIGVETERPAASKLAYNISAANIPADCTLLQAVGYFAGLVGANASIGRDGVLRFVTFTRTGKTIGRSEQYLNGYKKTTEKPVTIVSIRTGTANHPIEVGTSETGAKIEFENPLITEDIAQHVWETLGIYEFRPLEADWIGDPAMETGDIVKLTSKDGTEDETIVMCQKFELGGGIRHEIYSYGEDENKSAFTGKFDSITNVIGKQKTFVEAAIKNSTELITGNQGGYVVLHDSDEDGMPDEILIMDQPTKETATNIWRFNQAGLGHSTNYNGPYTLGITMDGSIVADLITAGTMQADRIKGGILSLGGENGDNGKLFMFDDDNQQIGSWDEEGLKVGKEFWVAYDPDTEKLQTFIGGFYAFTSEDGNAHYLATKDQSVGLGDHGSFAIWAGASDGKTYNNPAFNVEKNGTVHFTSLLGWFDNAVENSEPKIKMTATDGKITAQKVEIAGDLTVNGQIHCPTLSAAAVVGLTMTGSSFTARYSDGSSAEYSYTTDTEGRIVSITKR